ncbi:MAG: hypothetical protein JO126_02420 [Alphaproteobacteria bacterium]|nr:hypothetical protein [Alphaproteobacteria bacterium]
MSINEEGFLSPDISQWITKHRKDNSGWFSLTDQLNRLGQRLMLTSKPPQEDNQKILIAFYFVRVLSAFQGIIFLAERGMTVEAQTLARSCLETVFCISAIAEDPDFYKHLIDADTGHKTKAANRLIALPDALKGLTPEQTKNIENFVQSRNESENKGVDLNLYLAASKGGLSDIYDTLYRYLSNKAAHPSLAALDRYFSEHKIKWGPDVDDVAETLSAASMALLSAIKLFAKILGQDNYGQDIEACWNTYQTLIEEQTKEVDIEMSKVAT